MTIEDIITNISNQVGIDPATAEKAVGIILSVFRHEADGTLVGQLFSAIPGAEDLASRNDVMAEDAQQSGSGLAGLVSSALGSLLGSRAGALIQGVAQLQGAGLDMGQIQQTGASFVDQAKQATSPQLVDQIVESIPGLKGHFGL